LPLGTTSHSRKDFARSRGSPTSSATRNLLEMGFLTSRECDERDSATMRKRTPRRWRGAAVVVNAA
jgi:hypothetical protein